MTPRTERRQRIVDGALILLLLMLGTVSWYLLNTMRELKAELAVTKASLTAALSGAIQEQKVALKQQQDDQTHLVKQMAAAVQVQHIDWPVEYPSLYMGDGKVMCFVKPLGFHMILESADRGLTPHLCRGVGWEPEISSVFMRFVHPGSCVLDVGTNIGYFTLMFAQRVGPEGRVMGIEASPRTYELAGQTLEMHGFLSHNTQLLNKAVFSQDGKTVRITIDRKRPLNNKVSVGDNSPQQSGVQAADIETTTIDSAVSSWNRLDFIKIDVEGAEAEAYKGLKKTIQRFPDIIVVVEVNTVRMGPEAALPFYQSMQKDFPQLRRIVGDQVRHTTVDELMANRQGDDLVVLTKRNLEGGAAASAGQSGPGYVGKAEAIPKAEASIKTAVQGNKQQNRRLALQA